MKALVLTDYKHLELTDMPEPEIGDTDVLIQVKACGICGSDIHGYDGSSGRRIPPLIMGHEASGIIAEVGSKVSGLAPGMRVTFDSMVSCGWCHFCRRGQANLCDARRVLGVSCDEYRRHGAFADYVSVPQHIVYPLAEELPLEHAAMVEPVSVAVHAVDLMPIKLGDSAVVVGSGMIGLLVIQALRRAGCGKILAVDLDDRKLEKAKQLGADIGLNPKSMDVLSVIADETAGRGADHAMEVVGATAPLTTAVNAVRKGGAVGLVGNLSPTVDFPLQSVVTREITLYGSCGSKGEYPECLELMSRGAIQVEPLISAKAPLSDGPGWFDRLYSQEPGLMKVILRPNP
jgi:L-iditol 2-dehydrogenase